MELLAGRDREVEEHLRTLGWITADERVDALAPAGDGNMNRTLRARIGARTLILKQAVPFVARYPQIAAPVSRLNVEEAFYRTVSASADLALRMPRLLGADPANHLLCLEDLGEAADFTWLYREPAGTPARGGCDGQLTALVRWLGKLHGLPVAGAPDSLQNHAMRRLNHAHIFEIPFDPHNGVALAPELAAAQAEFAADSALRGQAETLGRIYLGEHEHASQPALVHGDYYPGSWLSHSNRGVMIIDPEFAFIGAPEFDVGVFAAHLLMTGHDQGDIMRLLHNYLMPAGFSYPLAMGFAGMEIIRRLLGVAQLPLVADVATRSAWLRAARQMVTG
jgi:5-methylthioribose kinase